MKRLLLITLTGCGLLASATTSAAGTTVFRCGPDGRELSDRPCPAGPVASQAIQTAEPSAQDAARARTRARQELRAVEQARQARERQEAARPRPSALGQPPAPASSPAPSKNKPKPVKYLGPASAPHSGKP